MTSNSGKWRLLDAVAGWRTASRSGLSFTPESNDIVLDPLPGEAAWLPDALASGLKKPVALAADSSGQAFVLDRATERVIRLDITSQIAKPIENVGGRGTQPCRFRSAAGVAVLPSGAIAVSDSRNGRVQLFSPSPYALLRVWRVTSPGALAADHCGVIYVVDSYSRRIARFHTNSDAALSTIGEGTLRAPSDVAVNANGDIAVVDGSSDSAEVVLFPAGGGLPIHVNKVHAPFSVAFDSTGNLFIGTADALVAKVEFDRKELDGYRIAGEGVTGVDGTVSRLAWLPKQGLLVILESPNADTPPRLATMNPAGAFRRLGQFETEAIDSGIEKCVWHRIQISGTVPTHSSLLIESASGETADISFDQAARCLLTAASNPDCLVQSAPGRFLRLRLTLRSSGEVTPSIHSIKVQFPRESYLQYLPAVFREDEESRLFLDRFLSIFQTSFDDFDRRIDDLWYLFDPFAVPDRFLPWLEAWLALPIDPDLTPAKRRELLKSAFRNYLLRGTVKGLEQVIQDYTGVSSVRVLEHFRLRNWLSLALDAELCRGVRLWSRAYFGRLELGVSSTVGSFGLVGAPEPAMEPFDWGANRFSVFFPAHPYRAEAITAKVQSVIDREKPAHAQATLCPVFPRLRVGTQASLGVDTFVAAIHPMVLGKLSMLSYDSVLACSGAERDMQSLGLARSPRLGFDARIL
jgi:phage tail-like protein